MSDAAPPKQLGRYEIVRELGRGAMGVVYEGRDPNIGRRVAIKTARRDVMAATGMVKEMMERFLREGRAAGALNHPNVITIYDSDEEDGIAYIAMEFIEGGSLADALRDHRRPGIEDTVALCATVAEALAAAHDAGIVHRDIKPANILLPKSGVVKIADFGIAHVSDSNLTQDGAMIGTPHYMSPEQFMGQTVDARSDLFSLGIILYEIVTGEKPFTGEALSTVMHHVIRTTPTPPHELNFNVGQTLSAVVIKCLAKRPADRYPDGRAFAAALRETLKPNPDPAVLQLPADAADATVSLAPSPMTTGETVITAAASTQLAPGVSVAAAAVAGLDPQAVIRSTGSNSATLPGAPPPGTLPPIEIAVAPKPARRLPLIAGGAALALVSIAVAVLMLPGRNEPASNPGAVVEPSATTAETPPATPTPAGNYYASLVLDVYQAKTAAAYETWSNQGDTRGIPVEALIDQPPCSVRVFDADTKELLSETAPFSNGTIPLTGRAKQLRLEVAATGEGQALVPLTLPRAPDSPGDRHPRVEMVLPPSR